VPVSKVDDVNKGIDKPIVSQEEMEDVLRRANFERQRKMQLQQLANDLESMNNRARSVSVGTAFGGAVDLTMRRPDGVCTYAILQPVEAIEVLHQLAAAVGCHLNLQPRQDFSSWRVWKNLESHNCNSETKNAQPHSLSHTPQPEILQENIYKGREMPMPEQQPGLQPALMAKETQDEQAVATEKTL